MGNCAPGPGATNGSLDLLVHLWKNSRDIYEGIDGTW